MNVLYICGDRGIPVLGNKGASVHVRSLTSAMQRLGHRVTLAARRWDEGNPAPGVARVERLRREPSDAVDQLELLIRDERPDVVIERYSLQSGPGRVASRRCGVPLTLEVNAPLAQEATRHRGLVDPAAETRERETLEAAERIHVVSSALLRYVRSVAPEVRAAWIPNGASVDELRAASAAAPANLSGRLVVGFVGSMKPWHGVGRLLEAFARVRRRYRQAALVLVGAGPEDAQLIERASRNDLRGGVVWMGQVPHARVPSLIGTFDVAVAPYLPDEEFYFNPLKVVEYLAAGKPVIYSDQGDLRALVGPAGLGYSAGSVGELADRLAEVLGNAQLRRDLAASAAARGPALDWGMIADRVVRFAGGEDTETGSDPLSPSGEPPGARVRSAVVR